MNSPMEVPAPFALPDVLHLEAIPSWPAWAVLRVASIRVVQQRSKKDGKFREVATLPANLIPTSAERADIERYLAGLRTLLAQIPRVDARWGQEMLVHIGKMLCLKPPRANEIGIEIIAEAYLEALDDVPAWAVRDAVRRWNSGRCGLNPRGEAFDYRWPPSPAELRRIALDVVWPLSRQHADLQRLLNAEQLEEFDEEHRCLMRKRLEELLQELKRRSAR